MHGSRRPDTRMWRVIVAAAAMALTLPTAASATPGDAPITTVSPSPARIVVCTVCTLIGNAVPAVPTATGFAAGLAICGSVSYTHLTLPTSDLV